MKPAAAKRLRYLASALTLLALFFGLFVWWFYFRLRQSLPVLDGQLQLAGLSAAVTIERDDLGVPTVTGQSRRDVAVALGYLHAQDRFFQMDTARRRSAGELSALIGPALVNLDQSARLHGFRKLAQTVLTQLPAAQRQLLEGYAEGVNEGLTQLKSLPFEYILLRQEPAPWKPEDSVLLIYTMTLDLQDETGGYEQSLARVRDTLGTAALNYFAPLIGPQDAALDQSTAELAPMPTDRMLDLRKRTADASALPFRDDDTVLLGSNSMALGGARTKTGAAMLANDMHLSLRLPNIWYRAALVFPDAAGQNLRVVGVTLPGTPAIIAGSNGRVAWGFTNANIDVSDLVAIDTSTIDPDIYTVGNELAQVETREETIQVRGEPPVSFGARWTQFGPIVGEANNRKPFALKWTMHDPGAANFDLIDLEQAPDVESALRIAQRSGIPVQNFLVADRQGRTGWTIAGKLPRRVGFEGRLPVSWTFGDRRWDGFLPPNDVPVRLAESDGQIWTANQRLVGGDALNLLGDGGYDRPHRGARIRDLITGVKDASPADLLAVQLDTGAPHLDRWHALLRSTLGAPGAANDRSRARIREAVEDWQGRAEVDSVSYRLVRRFRAHVVHRSIGAIMEPCAEAYPGFSYRRFNYEPALWDLLEKKPAHLLDPVYRTWDELLLASIDGVVEELETANLTIENATWGRANVSKIQHPFVNLSSMLEPFLRLRSVPLPGDYDTPRVQAPDDGASERFVVSPGREHEGIFHMPGGQSGHPLSPFFDAGHEAWIAGNPTPFLPGTTRHTLTLTPKSRPADEARPEI